MSAPGPSHCITRALESNLSNASAPLRFFACALRAIASCTIEFKRASERANSNEQCKSLRNSFGQNELQDTHSVRVRVRPNCICAPANAIRAMTKQRCRSLDCVRFCSAPARTHFRSDATESNESERARGSS